MENLLDNTDVFLFDCDGVMWKGNSLIAGSDKTIEWLQSLNKKVYFVTNNSTKSRAGYVKKFKELGMNVLSSQIYTTSYAAAMYLEKNNFKNSGKSVSYLNIL